MMTATDTRSDTDTGPGTSSDEAVIRVDQASLAFGDQVVLDDVTFEVRRGQTAVVLGRSGVGKSVLLKLIVRLLRPDAGRVYFRETDITDMNEGDLVDIRTRMGMLFQGAALFDSMTVYDNVAFALRESRRYDDDQIDRIVRERLEMVDVLDAIDKRPLELSGGMKKRVALARALSMDPEVLLYDEPTAGLDPVTSDTINKLICRTAEKTGATSVVVTHDITSAMEVGDRFLLLQGGQFVFDGSAEEVRNCDDPRVCRFMQGRSDTFDETADEGDKDKGASDEKPQE